MLKKGNPSVAIGIYAAVLHALNNMDKDLLLVAKDDELGVNSKTLNLPRAREHHETEVIDRGVKPKSNLCL